MKFNFTKVQTKNIDGSLVKKNTFFKVLANLLYHQAPTVDFVDIAIQINRGEVVELTAQQIQIVEKLVKDPEISGIACHARKSFQEYIDSIIDADRLDKRKEAKP